ncbi:MAG: hypothetical protein KKE23_01760 [Nanoarchaeota archaeon]|nr:hypothetical protein [Nanoarchaeota archaeon]
MKELISVILPVYGNYDRERFKVVVDSVKAQRGVNVETVYPDLIGQPILAKLINHGVKQSRGKYIYISDRDVALPSKYFLRDTVGLFEKRRKVPIARPSMRRLLLEDWETFKSEYETAGFEIFKKLIYDQRYVVRFGHKRKRLKVISRLEHCKTRNFIASEKDYLEFVSNKRDWKMEPKYFSRDTHYSGTILTKKQFEDVGGFCAKYVGWGCEDVDFQLKLRSRFGLTYFPKIRELEVIHLDHTREYYSPAQWLRNSKILDERRKIGADACILQDIKDNFG